MLQTKKTPNRNFSYFIATALFFLLIPVEALSVTKLNEMRVSYNKNNTTLRIVFDSNKNINYKLSEKANKSHIVIYLYNISIAEKFNTPKVKGNFVKLFKLTKENKNLKLNFKSNNQFKFKYFTLPPKDKYGYRLVVDIVFIDSKNKDQAKKNKIISKAKTIIAIDAGHGGKDPGAVGRKGTLEKDIVLSIAKKLYVLLKKEKNIKPILIRNRDIYMSLRSRINKARKHKADLFISIHADAARNKKAKGSSIYVLSQHGASSEAAKWLANKENSVDLVGGASIDDKEEDVAQVILDLSQSAAIETSLKASKIILSKLKNVSKLHSENVEQAGFVVLKSPDIPSILVETAFLSNRQEEKKLRTKKFQENIAKAIKEGILEIIRKGII